MTYVILLPTNVSSTNTLQTLLTCVLIFKNKNLILYMKKIALFIALLTLPMLMFGQKISLENIWQKGTFSPVYVSGFNFMNDGVHYAKHERGRSGHNVTQYDLRDGQQTGIIFNGEELKKADATTRGAFSAYNFSSDENQLLLATATEAIYRHSTRSNYYIYNRKDNALMPLSDGGKQRLAAFNPQGNKVAFVRENNLFYKDLESGKEVQITQDGAVNKIINGAADWVYEEEFGQDRAFYWSPDGNKIAFLRFDESEVKEFTMTLYNNGLYPDYSTFKYPKAGEKNATVTVHIYDVEANKTTKVKTGSEADIYFPRIKWTQDPSQLCVFRMNRHQNKLELLLAEATTGDTKTLLTEENKWYVDIHDNLTFLKNGTQFIWTSEKSGYNHIYLYDMSGKMEQQLTSGDTEVTNFYGVDEKNAKIYYQATTNPLERHIFCVGLNGKKPKQLTKENGTHSAQFSSTYEYFVNTHSAMGVPNTYTVKNEKGKNLRMIEDNKKLKNNIEKYNFNESEFFTFKTSDGVELNGYMIKPADFDPSKKYPVFMYVYGGPGSQTVKDAWGGSNYAWFQMLSQKNYIVVSVDNRGTGGRGEEFKKMTYQQLGKYETIDQIEAAKWLGSQSYVDADRIGIFGWSYGGYMSSLCLFKGNDVFKAAIAVAPVTNWKWYDTIYTERYMRTPKENKSGYEDNSPINFADRLKGSYLLVHGNADDNVHFQNSAEMAAALIKANKQFDTYFYPNRNHGIYGDNARIHLYTKMTNFILENL